MHSEMLPPERPSKQDLASERGAPRRDDPSNALGERLDSAIGETSSGIGALLSELFRRSLKTGVSEIGESLVEFAEERVEIAVERQMPLVAQTADSVATSASKRVIQSAVDEIREHSAKQKQELESEIQASETRVLDQSLLHIEGVVSEVRQSIDQTRILAAEGNDTSERKIEELREKARQSWKKFVDQFTTINDAQEKLRGEHESLRAKHDLLQESHSALHDAFVAASESIPHLQSQCSELSAQLATTQTRLHEREASWAESTEKLAERLSVLEQPRGLRRLMAKFQRNRAADE